MHASIYVCVQITFIGTEFGGKSQFSEKETNLKMLYM